MWTTTTTKNPNQHIVTLFPRSKWISSCLNLFKNSKIVCPTWTVQATIVCVCRFRNDQNYSLVCSKFSSFLINVFILLCSHSPTHTRQSNSIYFTMCLVDIVYGRRTVSNRYSDMLIIYIIYIIWYYHIW